MDLFCSECIVIYDIDLQWTCECLCVCVFKCDFFLHFLFDFAAHGTIYESECAVVGYTNVYAYILSIP